MQRSNCGAVGVELSLFASRIVVLCKDIVVELWFCVSGTVVLCKDVVVELWLWASGRLSFGVVVVCKENCI